LNQLLVYTPLLKREHGQSKRSAKKRANFNQFYRIQRQYKREFSSVDKMDHLLGLNDKGPKTHYYERRFHERFLGVLVFNARSLHGETHQKSKLKSARHWIGLAALTFFYWAQNPEQSPLVQPYASSSSNNW